MTDGPSAAFTFEAHAAGYDGPRRKLIPAFDAFYGTAVRALDLLPAPPRRVLDLGAGTGLLSGLVAAAHPQAELHLLDGAPAMLEQARERLGPGVTLHPGDLRGPLPGGRFDAIVSALAIHHLDDAAKRDLFGRVHEALAPGGVFVNAEQVAGPSPRFEAHYRAWHEATSRALGLTAEEWGQALERMAHDDCAPVGDQLAWMREAGFDADCLMQDVRFAVLVGVREGSGQAPT